MSNNNYLSHGFGLLLNAVTGEKYMVTSNKEFIIGRSPTCSLIIDKIYISRRHCIIKNENNQFIIYDNNTCSGTFLNCVQIPKGKNNFVILKHGDLIAFGDKGKSEFIYKFSLSSNVEKRPRIDNFIKKEGTVPEVIKLDDTNYKKFLTKLDSKILILKVEYLAFSNKTKMQISEFLILLNVALEWANKLNTEIMKHKYFIQEFNKNTTEEFHSTLILSQDNKNTQEPPKELMKIQVNNVLENIPLDSVYKEVMSKVQESNFKIDKESPTSFSDELTDFFSSSENGTQYDLHQFSKSSFTHKSRLIDQQLVKMLVKEYHSFKIIEDTEFKHLVKMLCPIYLIPNEKTLTENVLPQIYEMILDRMKNNLKNVSAVCLSIDSWNSLKNQCFITLTAHIIDPQNESQLSSILIGFKIFDEEYTDDSLARFLKNTVDEWNLSNKLTGVISANSVKIKAAIIKCNWQYLSCFLNSINLMGQSCLKSIEFIIYKVKEICMYFKNNSHALIKLTKLQEQTGGSSLKLKLDYPTCWKSTYDMINSIISLKKPIIATLASLNTYLDIPSPQEWIIVEYSRDILKMFYNVIMEISLEKYILISKELIFVNILNKHILKFLNDKMLPTEIQSMAKILNQQLYSIFGNIEENVLISQATLLDPRFKKFGFSCEETYNAALKYLRTEIQSIIIINQNESQIIQQGDSLCTLSSTIWEEFDKATVNISIGSNKLITETVEVDNYLNEPLVNRLENPLAWWAKRKNIYPRLYELVKRRLCVISTIVTCEKIFLKADQLVNEQKNKLSSNNISQILFLNQNM